MLGHGYLIYEEWKSQIDLWRLDLGGGPPLEQSALTSTAWEWMPSRSPDGKRVAFLSNRSGITEVWISDREDSSPRRLSHFDVDVSGRLAWSPDGQTIAVAVPAATTAFDLWSLDSTTGAAQQLTFDAGDELAPVYSPDGRELLFTSSRAGGWQIWALDLASGGVRQVTEDGAFACLPSADGTDLLYTKPDRSGIWRRKTDGEEELVVPDLPPSFWTDWWVDGSDLYAIVPDDKWLFHLVQLARSRLKRSLRADPTGGARRSAAGGFRRLGADPLG